jgi:uncharacterized protein (DUF608 family)
MRSADRLPQLAMPLGGLGAGCVSLTAFGGLVDFSIRHRPALHALPDFHANIDAAFAVLRVGGKKPITRLVEGPPPPSRIYDHGLKSQGHRRGGHEGLPRFARASFRAQYPVGEVALSDPAVPLRVRITAFSPFVPGDDIASGIPGAILEYTLQNPTRRPVDYQFSFHLSHLAPGPGEDQEASRTCAVEGLGIHYDNVLAPQAEDFGSAVLGVVGHAPVIKAAWLRGGWFDGISALWRELESGGFVANRGSSDSDRRGRNGGSVMLAGSLSPGQRITYPILIVWHFPNVHQRYGPSAHAPDDGSGAPAFRPFYAGQWKDALDVASWVVPRYAELRRRTWAFKDALFASTLPEPVLDAVSHNLAILKSPTILRQENGNLWGWEGCFPDRGCCEGSCTHVWNYAQAICHLFPRLERTLREQELVRSMDARGHVGFRSALPDGPAGHERPAAADGQLGGIMKLYRDWQISGDIEWLRGLYPLAKRSLDYCIELWDPERKGAPFEPHHNTYDIEFWGPDGMCTTIYVGALAAFAAMARATGHPEDAPPYEELAERGARFLDRELYDGEYFAQKVVRGGHRTASLTLVGEAGAGSEVGQLLRREGPKYQVGPGCLSDGVLGAWMAELFGIDAPFDRERVLGHLEAVFRHNFRRDLRDHACCQRPGYAIGHESGLLVCSWPKGGKPTLPFPYSDEVWTGIEYQVASHLALYGRTRESLAIVAGARARYDGAVRNPFDEYECGSFYARAMASYALLGAFSGVRYSAVEKCLWIAPKLPTLPFRCFFAAAGGWGVVTRGRGVVEVDLEEGEIELARLVVGTGAEARTLAVRATARPGSPARLQLPHESETKPRRAAKRTS